MKYADSPSPEGEGDFSDSSSRRWQGRVPMRALPSAPRSLLGAPVGCVFCTPGRTFTFELLIVSFENQHASPF